MATAMLAGGGRHAFSPPKLGTHKPVTGVKITVRNCDTRTSEQRRAELDAEAERLEVSRRFFL